jgi:hypothetical protein
MFVLFDAALLCSLLRFADVTTLFEFVRLRFALIFRLLDSALDVLPDVAVLDATLLEVDLDVEPLSTLLILPGNSSLPV